jgi:hypothetical protein
MVRDAQKTDLYSKGWPPLINTVLSHITSNAGLSTVIPSLTLDFASNSSMQNCLIGEDYSSHISTTNSYLKAMRDYNNSFTPNKMKVLESKIKAALILCNGGG